MISSKQNIILISLMACLLAVRVYLGRIASIFLLPGQIYDDDWMLLASELPDHFAGLNMPWHMLMIKDMGYPALLALIRSAGVQYTDAMAILWFSAAVLFMCLFRSITSIKHWATSAFIYAFVLFQPMAFDTLTSLRLYRNGALIPFYFIVLTMMGLIFARFFTSSRPSSFKVFIIFQLIFGSIFTWTYYMKEDGIWLLCCLVAILLLCTIKIIQQYRQSVKMCLLQLTVLFIPVLLFATATIAYKSINQAYFGVYETNNRTAGELGKFIKNVYDIKSAERSGTVWAPTDAVMKAFDVSDTLSSNNDLRDSVIHTAWFEGNIYKSPIQGDFLGWVMMTSISDTKVCHSLPEQEEFLRKANNELAAAFSNGRLEKDDSFRLTSSMGGRSIREILHLRRLLSRQYRSYIAMQGVGYTPYDYRIVFNPNDPKDHQEIIAKASQTVGFDLTQKNSDAGNAAFVLNKLFLGYAALQILGTVFALLGIGFAVKKLLARQKPFTSAEGCSLAISVSSLLLSVVYGIAVAWFCEFVFALIDWVPKFYGIGMIPMLTLFEVFGSYLFFFYLQAHRKNLQ